MCCKHCGDKLGLSLVLCNTCAYKALQQLPADPKERIEIYRILEKSDNPITAMLVRYLITDEQEILEQQYLDPTDRMFNEREI